MEVGTAFAARHVSGGYPRHYSAAFAFSILLYPHRQRLTLRFACPWGGQRYGLTEFRLCYTSVLGPVCPPVIPMSTCPECKAGAPITVPFWLELTTATLGSVPITTFIDNSLTLTITPSLAPRSPVADELHHPPRGRMTPRRGVTLSERLAHHRYR